MFKKIDGNLFTFCKDLRETEFSMKSSFEYIIPAFHSFELSSYQL